jgi:hypothetical protein
MSHVEPEHNRPQEGEEPDEPFPFDPPYRIDKPTTGEWTPESVRLMAVVNTKGAEKIADAHNAALAVERREKEESIADAKGLWDDCLQLRDQLAAERKTIAGLHRIIDGHDNQIQQLRTQLAAERDSHEKELDVVEANWAAEVKQLREQLGAAVEALMLARPCIVTEDETVLAVIDAALARIGEQK